MLPGIDRTVNRRLAIALAALLLAAPGVARAQLVEVSFLYKLSSTTGVIPFHGLNVSYDPLRRRRRWWSAAAGSPSSIPPGWRSSPSGKTPTSAASSAPHPRATGTSCCSPTTRPAVPAVVVANFRGEFKRRIEPRGLPAELPMPFLANAIGWAQGNVYLADLGGMRVVVLGMDGSFVAYHDLAKLCDVEKNRTDNGLKGFRVASNGDILFTVQPLFRAFVLQTDGVLQGFGVRGSAPGKFNIVSGIARDERGYYYVSDILKSAVLVFDKNFRWVKEFGYRGPQARQHRGPGGHRRGRRQGLRLPVRPQGRERLRGEGSRRSLIAVLGGHPVTSTYMGLPVRGNPDMGVGWPQLWGFCPSGWGTCTMAP